MDGVIEERFDKVSIKVVLILVSESMGKALENYIAQFKQTMLSYFSLVFVDCFWNYKLAILYIWYRVVCILLQNFCRV